MVAPTLNPRWFGTSKRDRLLRVVQPALLGLSDGTLSTLAPIFARRRFLATPLGVSLIQVTLAGIAIAGAGFAVGHA